MSQLSSHPEIELRAPEVYIKSDGVQHTTLLDLLEVYSDGVAWTPKLDHGGLIDHFHHADTSRDRDKAPSLRIFFTEDLNFLDASNINDDASIEDTTAYWMHQRFGVSPIFFSGITGHNFFNTGNASLVRKENGKRKSLDGLYRFSSGLGTRLTRVWFSHSLRGDRASTYVIHFCPQNARDAILSCAQSNNRPMLLRLLAIDAFLAEDRLDEWGRDVLAPRDELVQYENSKFSSYNPAQVAKAVENLHALSQLLHVITGHLADLQARLHFLIKVHRRLIEPTSRRFYHPAHSAYHPGSFDASYGDGNYEGDDEDAESILDSFEFMLSKTTGLMRWVSNYNERTGIRINLFFNISTQNDSRTNLDIARLTSKIAVSTQKDSSSMITMAAVTMFFLPGTFISALFSMVFFDTQDNGALIVSKEVWLFPTITIPLTIAVFGTWVMWQRYRHGVGARSLGIVDHGAVFEESSGTEKVLDELPR